MKLNDHLQPEDSPIVKHHEGAVTAFDLDSTYERGVMNSSQIKDNSVTSDKLSGTVVGSANIADGAITEPKIASFAVGSTKLGTNAVRNVNINDFAFSKGTGPITVTSGTISGVLLGTSTVQGGTIANALIGTSTVTGGTVNPASFSIVGTAGATGTAIYVKTITAGTASDWGTIAVVKGLVISIT
jgi:hypothetical protein